MEGLSNVVARGVWVILKLSDGTEEQLTQREALVRARGITQLVQAQKIGGLGKTPNERAEILEREIADLESQLAYKRGEYEAALAEMSRLREAAWAKKAPTTKGDA